MSYADNYLSLHPITMVPICLNIISEKLMKNLIICPSMDEHQDLSMALSSYKGSTCLENDRTDM